MLRTAEIFRRSVAGGVNAGKSEKPSSSLSTASNKILRLSFSSIGDSGLFEDFVELSRGPQQLQLRLLALESRVQIVHPLLIFIESRFFHVAKICFSLTKSRLKNGYVLLCQL